MKDVIKAVSAAASKSSGAFCSYTVNRSKQVEYQNVWVGCRNPGALLKVSKMKALDWVGIRIIVYNSLLHKQKDPELTPFSDCS